MSNKTLLKKSKGKYMASIPQRELVEAMKELSNGAYKLLMYYYSRNDGWKFNEDNMAKAIDSSVRQLKKYRKELIDAKYLLIQTGKVDVYFIGKLAVKQFEEDDYSELEEEILKAPLITKGS